jgi:hypothetical protein
MPASLSWPPCLPFVPFRICAPDPSLSCQTLTHPLVLVLHALSCPDVLNLYSSTRLGREAESGATAASLFPWPHQGLAQWPVDKCFPNWWMTAAGISGPTYLFAGSFFPAWELALFPHLFSKGLEIIFKFMIKLFSSNIQLLLPKELLLCVY